MELCLARGQVAHLGRYVEPALEEGLCFAPLNVAVMQAGSRLRREQFRQAQCKQVNELGRGSDVGPVVEKSETAIGVDEAEEILEPEFWSNDKARVRTDDSAGVAARSQPINASRV
jgi:hypothetical protein